MHSTNKLLAAGFLLFALALPMQQAQAQTTATHSGVNMWGIVPGGVSVVGALDSVAAHGQNGVVAGQVNAARNGVLSSSAITIQSIGSQSIVQTNIVGNNNSSATSANQTSSNTGAVTNTGTVNGPVN